MDSVGAEVYKNLEPTPWDHPKISLIMPKSKSKKNDTGANLGFEAKLWQAADALRNNMDAAEYKHVVLGLDLSLVSSDILHLIIAVVARIVFEANQRYRML